MELAPNHTIVEAAKALGGIFKLVNADDDLTDQGNIKEWVHTNHKAQMNTQV